METPGVNVWCPLVTTPFRLFSLEKKNTQNMRTRTKPSLRMGVRRTVTFSIVSQLNPHNLLTGGVVGQGETYEENARRELEEEMGVTARSETATVLNGNREGEEGVMRHCFSFHYKDDRTNVWGDVWDCVWGGAIVPQPVRPKNCITIRILCFTKGGMAWVSRLTSYFSLPLR